MPSRLQAAEKLKRAQANAADTMWAYGASPAPGALPRSPELLSGVPGTSTAGAARAPRLAAAAASRGAPAHGASGRRSPARAQGNTGEDALRLMRQPEMRPHLATTPADEKLDANATYRPEPEGAHDEQLFRGAAVALPRGHSQAAPHGTIHAGDRRCAGCVAIGLESVI